MKKIVPLFLTILLLLTFIGCKSTSESAKELFIKTHPTFATVKNVYQEYSIKTIERDLEDEGIHMFVLVFDPKYYECPYCEVVLPILNEVALSLGIERIDVLDIYTMRKNKTADYTRLLTRLKRAVSDLEEREGKLALVVPDFYVISHGSVLGHHIATLKDDRGNYLKTLTPEREEELKEIYSQLITSAS